MSLAIRTLPIAQGVRRANALLLFVGPALVLLLVFALTPSLNHAQQPPWPSQNPSGVQTRHLGVDPLDPDRLDPENHQIQAMKVKLYKALNAKRQQAMVDETDKLVNLSAQLRSEIDGSHPRALTSEQLHKVAEIEKLARNIRDKMSVAVGPVPRSMQPSSIMIGGISDMR